METPSNPLPQEIVLTSLSKTVCSDDDERFLGLCGGTFTGYGTHLGLGIFSSQSGTPLALSPRQLSLTSSSS
ncbi:hypothetical protein E2C01_050085 [Portunus trituberculatus]|uniref:Uncharacterized protein n=1 Tax=Portunus trituberculatus TaxID=210409 RepID=A0A5B7GB47_PORTR|nr:hypothetical protein [Portunus trituberculatus]